MKLKQIHEARERSVINVMGPQRAYEYNFDCYNKEIISLEGSPIKAETFKCNMNRLKSLAGGPKTVIEKFDCSDNELESLLGGPTEVEGDYTCSRNKLTSLEGLPSEIGGKLMCSGNQLTSFEGCTSIIGGNLLARDNQFESLHGIHKHIKEIRGGSISLSRNNRLENCLVGLILIKGLTKIDLDNKKLERILNKYLSHDNKKKAILLCQQELIEEGCEGAAQL